MGRFSGKGRGGSAPVGESAKERTTLHLTPEFKDKAREVWGPRGISSRLEELGREHLGLDPLEGAVRDELRRAEQLAEVRLVSVGEQEASHPDPRVQRGRLHSCYLEDLINQTVHTVPGEVVGLAGRRVALFDDLDVRDRRRLVLPPGQPGTETVPEEE